MTDDKPKLTRRRVLGSMAVVGGAGALGAGTWATFTDTEKKHVTVSAGTVDLAIDGSNGKTIYVSGDPLENGGVFHDCETLENVGTIAADSLSVDFGDISDYEHTREEPEVDAGDPAEGNGPDSGELSQYLQIDASLTCPSGEYPCAWEGAGTDGYIPLNQAEGFTVDFNGEGMVPDETCELCFDIKLTEEGLEATNANDAMSDRVEFDIVMTLEQKEENSTQTVDANSSPGEPDHQHNHGSSGSR